MSKHAPPVLATTYFPLMAEPMFGAEFEVFITSKQPAELGLFTITGASAGAFEADVVGAQMLLAEPQSLVVVVDEAIVDAGANIVLTVAGVAEDNSNITGTATITPPAYVNAAKTFTRGFAVDVIVSGDKKFKSINNNGITVVCNAKAANARIRVFGLPEIADFERVGCTGAGEFQPRVRGDAPVRCGSNPSAFVKEGDLLEGQLRVEAKYFNDGIGLARYAGQRTVVMLKEMRSGQKIPGTYRYLTQFVPSGRLTMPEGSEPVMNTADGRYQHHMTLLAPTAAIAILFGLSTSFGPLFTNFGALTIG